MVLLKTNTGSEIFDLRTTNFSFTGERDLKTDAINQLELAGYDPELLRKERTIEAVIPESVDQTDFPNPDARTYPSAMHGFAVELERILNREQWNPVLTLNPSELQIDRGGFIQTVQGVVVGVDVEFNVDQNQYRATITFLEIDVDLA
jgi:hypothetical protein